MNAVRTDTGQSAFTIPQPQLEIRIYKNVGASFYMATTMVKNPVRHPHFVSSQVSSDVYLHIDFRVCSSFGIFYISFTHIRLILSFFILLFIKINWTYQYRNASEMLVVVPS